MFPTSPQPITAEDLASAMQTAARRIGLEGTFLRIVAAELPDNCWRPEWAMCGAEEETVQASAPHICLPACDATAGTCVTALKLEQFISRELDRPYGIATLRLEADRIVVTLQPY